MVTTHLIAQFNEAAAKKHANEDQKIHPLQELTSRIRKESRSASGSEEAYARLLINAIERATESAIEENIKILIAELHSIKESDYWKITSELTETRSIALYFLNYAYAPKIHAVEFSGLKRYFADNRDNLSIISELHLSVKQALLSLLVRGRVQDFKNIFEDDSEKVISQIVADENLVNWKAPNGKTAIALFRQEFLGSTDNKLNITELSEAVEKGDYGKVKEVLIAVGDLELRVDGEAKKFIGVLIDLLVVANRAYEQDYIHISVCHALIEALQLYYSINSFSHDRTFNRIIGKVEMPIEIELISYLYELQKPTAPNWREQARQQLVGRLTSHFQNADKVSMVKAMFSLEKIALLYLLTEKKDYFTEIFGKEKDAIIAMLLNDKRLTGFQYVAKSGNYIESFSLLNRAVRNKRNDLLPLLVKAGYPVYSTEGLDGRSALYDAVDYNHSAIKFLAQNDPNKKLAEMPSYHNYNLWKRDDPNIDDLLTKQGYSRPTGPAQKGFFAWVNDGIRSFNISLSSELLQTPFVQSAQDIILKEALENGTIADVKNCILNRDFEIPVEKLNLEEIPEHSDVQDESSNNLAHKKILFFSLLEAWQERSYQRYRQKESKHLIAHLDEYDITKFSFLFEPKFLKKITVDELQSLSFAARITCAFFLAKLANEEVVQHFTSLYKAEEIINFNDKQRITLLHVAARYGNHAILTMIDFNQVNVNIPTAEGVTALYMALSMLEQCIKKSDINWATDPLVNSLLKSIEILYKNGANERIKISSGQSAVDRIEAICKINAELGNDLKNQIESGKKTQSIDNRELIREEDVAEALSLKENTAELEMVQIIRTRPAPIAEPEVSVQSSSSSNAENVSNNAIPVDTLVKKPESQKSAPLPKDGENSNQKNTSNKTEELTEQEIDFLKLQLSMSDLTPVSSSQQTGLAPVGGKIRQAAAQPYSS